MTKPIEMMEHVELTWPTGYPVGPLQRYGHAIAYDSVHQTYDVVLLDGTMQQQVPGSYVREIEFAESQAVSATVRKD